MREDGRPVRLYPVPLRYLDGADQFKLYEWVTVAIAKSTSDLRPESYKIDSTRIARGEFVPPDPHGWQARRALVFKDPSWHFANVDALLAAEKAHKTSFGTVAPGVIEEVYVAPKPAGTAEAYARQLERLQAQQDAFVTTYKQLGFRPADVKLRWRCAGAPHAGRRPDRCGRPGGARGAVRRGRRRPGGVRPSDPGVRGGGGADERGVATSSRRLHPAWR